MAQEPERWQWGRFHFYGWPAASAAQRSSLTTAPATRPRWTPVPRTPSRPGRRSRPPTGSSIRTSCRSESRPCISGAIWVQGRRRDGLRDECRSHLSTLLAQGGPDQRREIRPSGAVGRSCPTAVTESRVTWPECRSSIPAEPDLGTKIMYDLWYDFWPFLISYHSHFFIEDRYGNTTPEESIATTWQLMHLSDSPVSDQPAVRGWHLSQHPRPAVAARAEQIHHRAGLAARRSQRGAGKLRVPALVAPPAAAFQRRAMLADPGHRLGAGRQQRRYRLPVGVVPRQLPG